MKKIVKRVIFLAVVLAVVGLGIWITLKNTDPITVNFLIYQVTTSAANVIIGTFVFGGLLGLLAGIGLVLQLKWTKRSALKKVENIQREIDKIRASPIKE